MSIKSLVDKYFEQIEVENADYVPFDDAKSDAASILLNVPITMLKEYLQLKRQRKKLPEGAEFWKETGLCSRLKSSKKHIKQFRSVNHLHDSFEKFPDFLDGLTGEVQGDYQELGSKERIRLSITEIPTEFYKIML
jgi:hypothetical protein